MKKAFLLSAILSSCLFAQTAYVKNSEPVALDGKRIGFVSLLTPVETVKANKDKTEVSVVGFVQEGYQEKLVRSPALGEEFVVFEMEDGSASYKGDKNPYIKILEKTEDDYGEVWLKAEFKFEVTSENLTNDPEPLYSNAKNLFEQTCSACHILHEPNSYTVNQWPSQIESMISSGFVGLEDADKNAIIKYLQHNARDAVAK